MNSTLIQLLIICRSFQNIYIYVHFQFFKESIVLESFVKWVMLQHLHPVSCKSMSLQCPRVPKLHAILQSVQESAGLPDGYRYKLVQESGVPDDAYLAPSGTDGFGDRWSRRTARTPRQRLSSSATAASTVTYGDGSDDRLDQQIGASRVGGSGKRLWRR